MSTEWLATVIKENWPWLVVAWIVLRAMSWWIQAVGLTSLDRRLDRYARDEFSIVRQGADARRREASSMRDLLAEIDRKLLEANRLLGQLAEKEKQAKEHATALRR